MNVETKKALYKEMKAELTGNCGLGSLDCPLSSQNNGFGIVCNVYEDLHFEEAFDYLCRLKAEKQLAAAAESFNQPQRRYIEPQPVDAWDGGTHTKEPPAGLIKTEPFTELFEAVVKSVQEISKPFEALSRDYPLATDYPHPIPVYSMPAPKPYSEQPPAPKKRRSPKEVISERHDSKPEQETYIINNEKVVLKATKEPSRTASLRFKKVVVNGEKKLEFVGAKNVLSYGELPTDYVLNRPLFYNNWEGVVYVIDENEGDCSLIVGNRYSVEKVRELIGTIKQAGERFAEFNRNQKKLDDNNKKLAKEWRGERVFKI